MCGIAGYVGREADERVVRRMCDVIRHRGPDDEGYLVEGDVAMGMRRLAIIDLSSGKQPIFNEDGAVGIVYNGEVYNFGELRRDLETRSHRFRTNTDTECIVHLYEEYGDGCVERLRGMFAFALWDAGRHRLLLARDRVGKKPLFYRHTREGLWFASEIKSLLQDRRFEREVDPVALHHYLTLQYVPAPLTIYRGISKLPPGHTLCYANGEISVRRYWELDFGQKIDVSEAEATERVRSLIRESTRIRLVSDRPVGAFLSGGVDSSLVVAAMAEAASGTVKTFSIGFEETRFDERRFARLTAERFSTEHHEFVVRPSALDVLPTLVWHYDEPFADSSAIPSYYVSKLTSEHVTVALNGDGGDESFAGYDRYVTNMIADRLPVPRTLSALALRGLDAAPRGLQRHRMLRGGRRVLDLLTKDEGESYAALMAYFTREEKHALYTTSMREAVDGIDTYRLFSDAFASSSGRDVVDRMLDVDIKNYLPGDLLVKMDIATMANSLEARSPLLDHVLMEFAASLPSRMKLRGLTKKYILKRVARGWLPDEVIDRPKMGFGVPLARWLRTELRDLAHDTLTDRTARERGYFDPAAVTALLAEHEMGVDRSSRIWALLVFELWHRMFIDASATTAPARLGP